MKHLIAGLLALLMLTGCSAAPLPETTASVPTESQSQEGSDPGLWEVGHSLEIASQGGLRVYPLGQREAYAMYAMGENLLVLSGRDSTRLTRLSGEALQITVEAQLDLFLEPEAMTITPNGLSYYDSQQQQVVVLDATLKEIRHMDLPDSDVRTPLLTADQETLFYCTSSAIKAWDLDRDLQRTVKEMKKGQALVAIYEDGAVLQCQTEDGIQLLSCQDGSLLWEGETLTLSAASGRYYAAFPSGSWESLVFGGTGNVQALTPADPEGQTHFLPRQNAALSLCPVAQGQLRLDYYDLSTGRRTACLPLAVSGNLVALEGTSEGWVYLLMDEPEGGKTIYRWDPQTPAINDGQIYTGPYYTADHPDYHSLLALQAQANALGVKYGVEILLWDDALACQPWDYTFTGEYLVPLLQSQLTQLEQWMDRFPPGFLETTADNFTALKICLVRSISGTPESGSLDCADGIQFFSGTNAYIVLALGSGAEQAFYHELYHVMETQLLNKSIALDQWDKLNPAGFAYDYDYAANATREVGSWLDPDIRSFVDRYAMSFPKEDRARLFEYAMIPGSDALFEASPLQYKLKTLCQGIREAYGLKNSTEDFPWEQYLLQSLAPEAAAS